MNNKYLLTLKALIAERKVCAEVDAENHRLFDENVKLREILSQRNHEIKKLKGQAEREIEAFKQAWKEQPEVEDEEKEQLKHSLELRLNEINTLKSQLTNTNATLENTNVEVRNLESHLAIDNYLILFAAIIIVFLLGGFG